MTRAAVFHDTGDEARSVVMEQTSSTGADVV